MSTHKQEFVPGIGWLENGQRIYEETGKSTPVRPVGKVWVESHANGYWVMDRLGSLHRNPFRYAENAERFMKEAICL